MTENENDFDWSVYDYLVYKYGNIQKAFEEIEKEFEGDHHEK